jgi:hypothetical protein
MERLERLWADHAERLEKGVQASRGSALQSEDFGVVFCSHG